MPLTKDFAPRLFPAPQAAHYLGVSVSKLATLSIQRRVLGGKRVYDRNDLDAFADDLPYEVVEKQPIKGKDICDDLDQAFGVVR